MGYNWHSLSKRHSGRTPAVLSTAISLPWLRRPAAVHSTAQRVSQAHCLGNHHNPKGNKHNQRERQTGPRQRPLRRLAPRMEAVQDGDRRHQAEGAHLEHQCRIPSAWPGSHPEGRPRRHRQQQRHHPGGADAPQERAGNGTENGQEKAESRFIHRYRR